MKEGIKAIGYVASRLIYKGRIKSLDELKPEIVEDTKKAFKDLYGRDVEKWLAEKYGEEGEKNGKK